MRSHPTGLYILSFAEMWERFSFYGMRALLILYLTSQLNYADEKSYVIFGVYATLIWAAPVLGGYIADKILGFQRAILLGSLIILSGHLCIAFLPGEAFFYLGLGLVVSGTGFFKSNVSSMIGALYQKDDPKREVGFTIFYVCFNFGSFLSPMACGYIASVYGWDYGFGVAGLGMLLGMSVLFLKRAHFKGIGLPPKDAKYMKHAKWVVAGGVLMGPLFALLIYSTQVTRGILPVLGFVFLGYLIMQALKSDTKDRQGIIAMIIAMLVLMLSSALLEQIAMSVSLFIERNVDRTFLGWTIPTSFFHSIDPLTVILIGPLISLWWSFSIKRGKPIKPSTKFLMGFISLIVSYAILSMSCQAANAESLSPLFYVMIGLVFLAAADIFIYPVILSLCTQLSPLRMQGVMMGGVMLSTAFSQLIASWLSTFASVSNVGEEGAHATQTLSLYDHYFQQMTWLAVGMLIVVFILGFWMNRAISTQKAA